MAKVGVFDEWGTRAQLLDALDRMMGHSAGTHAAAEAGQMMLFGGSGGGFKIDVNLLRSEKEMKPVERRELLDWEKELIGVYLTAHPLEDRLADLQDVITARTGELDATWNGKGVTLAGIVAGLRTLNTKKGQPMAFVTLEDLDGKVDLVVFPKVWAVCREQVQSNQIIVVGGTVQAEGESISILANVVRTKLTVAGDAAQARRIPVAPMPVHIAKDVAYGHTNMPDDYWPPPDDYGYGPNWDYGDNPPNGKTPTPAHPVAESAAAYLTAHSGVTPPPDDEDDYQSYETIEEETPTLPDPAAVEEAQEPMPPPVVEMPVMSDERRATKRSSANADERRTTNDDRATTPYMNGGGMSDVALMAAAESTIIAEDLPLRAMGMLKLLVVEIRASGNWKETCRQSLKLAGRFEGNATLRLQLTGQDLVMDFPNHRTGCEVELIEALERLPGVGRVYER